MGRTEAQPASQVPENVFTAPDGFFDGAVLLNSQWEHVGGSSGGGSATGQKLASVLGLDKRLGKLVVVGEEGEGERSTTSKVGGEGGDAEVVDGGGPLQSWACKGCRAVFHSLEEQRSHYKSDFHRFNVKRRLAGKDAIREEEFEGMAHGNGQHDDDDISSISGSDSDSEAEDNRSLEQVQQGPRQNRVLVNVPNSGRTLLLWRCLLAADKEVLPGEKGYAENEITEEKFCLREDEALRRLRCLTSEGNRSLWVILLAAGGHFAGLVVNTRGGSVIAHQTFHRYVVRAKAGGRQSTRDATGRAPKSAGASLRRYNEQALQKNIRDLLSSWSEHLQAASHLFVYAPSSNAQTLYGGENLTLNRNDRRIRRIPFTTRRPTMKEAKRINFLLGSLYQLENDTLPSSIDTSATLNDPNGVAAMAEGLNNSGNVPTYIGKPSKAKKVKAQKVEKAVTEDPLEDDLELKEEEDQQQGLTPLHEAAKAGEKERILQLLEEGADPCVKEKGGRTPYAFAVDKDTRNVFRRFMALHPDKWDWHVANVPSPLTDELEAAQLAKQAEKDSKRKAKEKERKKLKKAEDKVKQAEAKAAEAAAKAAEVAAIAAANVRYDKDRSKKLSTGLISLDPKSKEYQEAMLKAHAQERETRAAAAEFRLRALANTTQGPTNSSTRVSSSANSPLTDVCTCCGASLVGKVPFTKYSYRYCSTSCVRVHKMALEED